MDTIATRRPRRRPLALRLWRGYVAWRLEIERARYATSLAAQPRRSQRALRALYAEDQPYARSPARPRMLVRTTARPVSSLVSAMVALGAVLLVVVVLY